MRFRLILGTVVLLAGCRSKPVTTAAIPCENRPTAAEVFNLRGKCVELGNKLADDKKLVGQDFSQSMESHYSQDSNRCYVTLTDVTSTLGVLHGRKPSTSIHLYDGQTGVELAEASEGGMYDPPSGLILRNGVQQPMTHGEAQLYIDKKMAEESQ